MKIIARGYQSNFEVFTGEPVDLEVIPESIDSVLVTCGVNRVAFHKINGQWEVNLNTNIKVTQNPPNPLNMNQGY